MKKYAIKAFLLFMGLILASYAVVAPMLGFFGAKATAHITDIRRCRGERNEAVRNRYDYGVGFYFKLPNGERVEGGTTVVGSSYSAGIAKGPATVYYFPAWPRIHVLEREAGLTWDKPILLAVGIALVVIALKKEKPRPSKKQRAVT